MKYKDLENFTHNELSHFTYAELMLGKLELFEKASNNLDIPREIVDKLYDLCSDVLTQYKDIPVSIPKEKEKLTLKNIIKIIGNILILKEFTLEVLEILKSLIKYFKIDI